MSKTGRPKIGVKLAHTVKELKAVYQKSTCAVERRRTQAIWLLGEGKTRKEVEQITAYSAVSLVNIIKNYNEEGLAGLKDKRHNNEGRSALLSDEEMLQLAQEIRKDYQESNYWSGKDVIKWIKETLGKDIHKQRAYEYLSAVGMSMQTPRPHHAKADPIAQDIFKKNTA